MTTQDGYDWPTPHPVAPLTPADFAAIDREANAYYREQIGSTDYRVEGGFL